MLSFVGLLSGLVGLMGLALKWLQQRHDEQMGAAAQTASESAQAIPRLAAIAQAEVDAPKTKEAVLTSLEQGSF
jgi:hypothetical protein